MKKQNNQPKEEVKGNPPQTQEEIEKKRKILGGN